MSVQYGHFGTERYRVTLSGIGCEAHAAPLPMEGAWPNSRIDDLLPLGLTVE